MFECYPRDIPYVTYHASTMCGTRQCAGIMIVEKGHKEKDQTEKRWNRKKDEIGKRWNRKKDETEKKKMKQKKTEKQENSRV